jgi:hypothetical protein
MEQWLKQKMSIFYKSIPTGIITIKPHSDNEIYTVIPPSSPAAEGRERLNEEEKRLYNSSKNCFMKFSTMDSKIMKRIRAVLYERDRKKEEKLERESLVKRIDNIEKQLKVLVDSLSK